MLARSNRRFFLPTPGSASEWQPPWRAVPDLGLTKMGRAAVGVEAYLLC
jgi:hypothetical protein